jgi:DNA-binding transcriptional regulator YiaG
MRMVRKTFRKGDDRLERILAKPGMTERVGEIREASAREDRIYALNLATIRKAAELTQDDLAQRLGIDQSVVSKTERREDMLLSTLMDYLSAAGVEDAKMVVRVNGREIELDLRSLQHQVQG